MENLINEVENQEVADKMVKLRPSQKQLLEGMKLANKESLADVLDRILEERQQLSKKLEKEFNKSAIKRHNDAVMDHVRQIIAINTDIERQAQHIVDLEMQKYYASIEEVQETLIMLADTKQELDNIKLEYEKVIEQSVKLEKDLQEQQEENEQLKKANEKLDTEKNDYITKFNEVTLDVNRLRDKNIELTTQINDKNNKITSIENHINNLNTTIETKQTEIDNLKVLNETLNNDKKYLQETIDKTNDKLEKSEARIADVFERQSDLVTTNAKLEEQLRNYNTKINELENDKNKLQEQINKSNQELEATKQTLINRESELNSKIKTLELNSKDIKSK